MTGSIVVLTEVTGGEIHGGWTRSGEPQETTAKLAGGRLLLVDSKFDEPVTSPPYEVVSLRAPR